MTFSCILLFALPIFVIFSFVHLGVSHFGSILGRAALLGGDTTLGIFGQVPLASVSDHKPTSQEGGFLGRVLGGLGGA